MKPWLLALLLLFAPNAGMAQTSAPPAPEPPSAATPDAPGDPLVAVRHFYPLRGDAGDPPYSARLQKLFDAALANSKKINAPVAGLDFAFQVNAQDTVPGYEKTIKYNLRRMDGKKARVRVSLRNMRNVELIYDLVHENGRWLVDDVRSIREPRWVLSRMYINGAKEK